MDYCEFLKIELESVRNEILDRIENINRPPITDTDIQTDIQNMDSFLKAFGKAMKSPFDYEDFLSEELWNELLCCKHILKTRYPKHPIMNQPVTVQMTVGNVLEIAHQQFKLKNLLAMEQRLDAAIIEFKSSSDRHNKKLTRLANRIGVTNGVREKTRDDQKIFENYVKLVNGVECEPLTKLEACEAIQKKYALTTDALKTILKKVHAGYPGRFRGLLPS